MNQIRTTPSQENYVETIFRLSQKGSVRAGQLAEALGVSRPSVTKAVSTLTKQGFVCHKPYDNIELTEKGNALGAAIVRRDDCLTELLVTVLGMSPESADPEVHRLEHVLSDEVLTRLETLVRFATSSPAWLKRLHHRIDTGTQKKPESSGFMVGRGSVHSGHSNELPNRASKIN